MGEVASPPPPGMRRQQETAAFFLLKLVVVGEEIIQETMRSDRLTGCISVSWACAKPPPSSLPTLLIPLSSVEEIPGVCELAASSSTATPACVTVHRERTEQDSQLPQLLRGNPSPHLSIPPGQRQLLVSHSAHTPLLLLLLLLLLLQVCLNGCKYNIRINHTEARWMTMGGKKSSAASECLR